MSRAGLAASLLFLPIHPGTGGKCQPLERAEGVPWASVPQAKAVQSGSSTGTSTPSSQRPRKRPRRSRRPPREAAAPPAVNQLPEVLPAEVDVFGEQYVGAPLSVDLDAAPLFQFLEYFSEQFGFSFVLDKSVREVEPISIRARQVPWNVLVRAVLRSRGLVIQRQENFYRVLSVETAAAEAEAQRKAQLTVPPEIPLETRIYRLRYRSVRTGGYLRSGAASGTGGAGGGGLPGAGAGAGVAIPERTGDGSPPPGLVSGFRAILVNQLTKDGTIEEDPVANLLIVRDRPDVHEKIARILSELDRPEPQIEVEARILIARRDYARQLGALLNAAVAGNGAVGQGGTAVNPLASRPGVPPIAGQQPSEVLGLGSAASGVLAGTVQRGTYILSAALSALEARGVAQTILAPRLIVVNNTPANIGNGVDIPYVQAAPVPGGPGGGAGVGVAQVTQLVNASLGFSVTPQILGEGEEILLSIEIRNDSPSGATPLGQPLIQRQNVTTSVRCANGGSLLLSGLLSDREDQTINSIPGLRSLPVLGKLFQRQERNRTQFELIFFVTARIIQDPNPAAGTIVERPEGIALPNTPEYAAPVMPPIDMPERLRRLPTIKRQLQSPPTTPNVPGEKLPVIGPMPPNSGTGGPKPIPPGAGTVGGSGNGGSGNGGPKPPTP